MVEDTWHKVVEMLKATPHTDAQPNAEGKPCGCLRYALACACSAVP